MSYREPAFYLSKGAFARFNGVILDGATQFQGVTIQGNTPEINRTVLTSPRQEYTGGIPDSGAISTTVLAAPHTPIYRELEDSNDGSKVRNLEIFVGAIPTNGRETDGSEIEVIQEINQDHIETSFTTLIPPKGTPAYPTSTILIEEPYLRELSQGVAVGDFFRVAVGSTNHYLRISAIDHLPRRKTAGGTEHIAFSFNVGSRATGTPGSDFAAWPGTGTFVLPAAFTTSANTVSVVRPAFKYTLPVYAMNIGQGFGTGGLIDKQITFRITSQGTRTVGVDGVKANDYIASAPGLAFTGSRHFTTLN